MEMNFCRRCGSKLVQSNPRHMYTCTNGHHLYANSSPAVALILRDSKDRVLTVRRSLDPGKGELDYPGGFCDDHETGEAALEREIIEEIGLESHAYTTPELICTGIDDYAYKGEYLPVFSLVYTARLIDDTIEIIARDDAEQATFMPLNDINPDDIYFDALKLATKKLRRQYGYEL